MGVTHQLSPIPFTAFLTSLPPHPPAAIEAMAHPFFDPLRKSGGSLNGLHFCNWVAGELDGVDAALVEKLQPAKVTHALPGVGWGGVGGCDVWGRSISADVGGVGGCDGWGRSISADGGRPAGSTHHGV